MFQLTSERLWLIPLDLSQLHILVRSRMSLEESLGLEPFGLEINASDSFIEEYHFSLQTFTIPRVTEYEANYEWYTLWLVIHRLDNRAVGNIGIAGLPNERGEVMIGYFTDGRYEGQGIMTEAVGMLLDWIFQNAEVQSVIADTLVDGIASQKVLQKNGFVQDGTTDEGLRWRRYR